MRRQHQEKRFPRVSPLCAPDHRWDVEANVGAGQPYLLSCRTIVDEAGHGTACTDKELVTLAVGVRAAHRLARNVENREEPLRHKGSVANSDAVTLPEIAGERETNQAHAVYPECS